ncbi:GYF domain-containing protein [Opitutales bacterium]|nr:GYF domain-containing protein [Opitutales bacterium]
MQIHIHKDGKNYGPYPIEQVRQFLKAGNFTGNDLACHDGANWIKLSQVPGIAPAQPKPVAKQVEQPAKVKVKPVKNLLGIKLLIVGFFLALVISLAGLTYYLLGSDEEEEATAPVTNDENLFILSPDQVVDVYDGDTFKIDLPSMHPLFGDDISIRLFGVDTPEMRGATDEVKALAMQAQQLTEKALKGASKIELRNP